MNNIKLEFSRPFYVEGLKSREKTKKIVANDEEKQALAKRFDVLAVKDLSADLKIIPLDNNKKIRLEGLAKAKIVQKCVVSLEEMVSDISEEIRVIFDSQASSLDDLMSFDLSLDDEDPPEQIKNGVIDLGEVVVEHLSLSINPYPRKDDAIFCFEDKKALEELEKSNPFAVLSSLIEKKD